jgi:hypothetical protein
METMSFGALLRRLPPETAHNAALWVLRLRLWDVRVVLGALLTLAWAAPCTRLLHWCKHRMTP